MTIFIALSAATFGACFGFVIAVAFLGDRNDDK